jgi:hypothetical protein
MSVEGSVHEHLPGPEDLTKRTRLWRLRRRRAAGEPDPLCAHPRADGNEVDYTRSATGQEALTKDCLYCSHRLRDACHECALTGQRCETISRGHCGHAYHTHCARAWIVPDMPCCLMCSQLCWALAEVVDRPVGQPPELPPELWALIEAFKAGQERWEASLLRSKLGVRLKYWRPMEQLRCSTAAVRATLDRAAADHVHHPEMGVYRVETAEARSARWQVAYRQGPGRGMTYPRGQAWRQCATHRTVKWTLRYEVAAVTPGTMEVGWGYHLDAIRQARALAARFHPAAAAAAPPAEPRAEGTRKGKRKRASATKPHRPDQG